jgi:hypothetical protein
MGKERESGWWIVCGLAPLVLLLAGCGLVDERPSLSAAPDTGIPVTELFADFYQEMGGASLLGQPLTQPFRPAESEPLLQYFQMIRLEYDGQQVQITPLGAWALAGVGPAVEAYAPAPTSRIRIFEQTGQPVWDEFLAFYEANRGELLLGLPLSPQLNEGNRRVQYFENGRLEWHPELPVGQRVQLTPLGEAHFQSEMRLIYQDGIRNAGPVPAAGLTHVHVSASVSAPILYAGDEQILYVTVLRPDGRPVSDVAASVTVSYGETENTYPLDPPDGEGKIQARLSVADVPPGHAVLLSIRVYAPDSREIGHKTIGFRTWW